ncbi:MAG: cyclic nucleotide-binding domain-containing protein [Deltaproteobacteria bacterium]|nr:cyclic nucleotide-binding domain-containing protein [Deltaproteobacteria bacterium]
MSGITEVVSGRLLKIEEQIAHQLHSSEPLKAGESGQVKKDDFEQQSKRQRSEGEWLKSKPDLSKVVIPKGFHPKDIELMAEVCRYIRFPKGAFLCRQNEPGMACYFILQGKVNAFQELNGQTQALAILQPGTVIGQIALVNNIRRSATLKALEDVLTLEVTCADFQQLMQSASPTALKFQEQIAITGIRQHRGCMARFSSTLRQVRDVVKAREIARLETAQKKNKATAKPKKTQEKTPDMEFIAKYLASLSEWGITTETLNNTVIVQLDGEIPPDEIRARLQNS